MAKKQPRKVKQRIYSRTREGAERIARHVRRAGGEKWSGLTPNTLGVPMVSFLLTAREGRLSTNRTLAPTSQQLAPAVSSSRRCRCGVSNSRKRRRDRRQNRGNCGCLKPGLTLRSGRRHVRISKLRFGWTSCALRAPSLERLGLVRNLTHGRRRPSSVARWVAISVPCVSYCSCTETARNVCRSSLSCTFLTTLANPAYTSPAPNRKK